VFYIDHVVFLVHLKCVLEALRCEKLYANVEKCVFCMDHVIFLGFIVSSQGVQVDPEKVKLIQDWPTPKNISEIRNFHGLASFYRRFVRHFSTLVAPLNEIVKKNVVFELGDQKEKAFTALLEKLTNALVLALANFAKSFKLECDAFGAGIGLC